MPRTFFGRSEIANADFRNTDLSESCMCWNDFIDCDLSYADLSRCDLRASRFIRCKFAGAKLRNADLRRSFFEDCDFTGADVTGTLLGDQEHLGAVQDCLSEEQWEVAAWVQCEGEEPPGG